MSELYIDQDEIVRLLKQAAIDMKHSKIFISSRQKMHHDGISLFNENIQKIDDFLSSFPTKPPITNDAIREVFEKLYEGAKNVHIGTMPDKDDMWMVYQSGYVSASSRVAELEAEIERLKCCGNCNWGHNCEANNELSEKCLYCRRGIYVDLEDPSSIVDNWEAKDE